MKEEKKNPAAIPIGEELMRTARSKRIGKPRFRFAYIDAEKAYKIIAAFYIAEVERRGRQCILNDFTADKIWQVAEFMTSDSPQFGLLFTGKVGNGKTTLLHALDQASIYETDMGLINPSDFGFEHLSDVGFEIYTTKELVQTAKMDYERFERIISAPWLAIDELGEEPKEVLEYGNVLNPILDLVEKRYARQKFTVITSNLDPEEISARYGVRIADRFREMLKVVVFGNQQSYRR